MGRKLNISTPTVINTELVPLTTSFWLEPNGLTEQWYYENTNVFSPDRQITPLVITPRISAVDTDTNTSYTPVINNVQWVVQWWNGTQWVESVITNNIDSFDEDYVIDGNTLIVHKNNADPTHSINIRCTATYRDPRDAGATYTAQESLSLTTDRDATVISPKIDVLSEPSVTFNPFKSQTSLVEFKGIADWSGRKYAPIKYIKKEQYEGYFDTNYMAGSATKIVLDLTIPTDMEPTGSGFPRYLFSGRGGGGINFDVSLSRMNQVRFAYSNTTKEGSMIERDVMTRIVIDGGVMTYTDEDGNLVTLDSGVTTTWTSNVSLVLWTYRTGDAVDPRTDNRSIFDFHRMQIYEDDVLVRDYLPSLRVEDETTGLLDLANNTFGEGNGLTLLSGGYFFEWYGVKNGAEVKIDTLPCYVSGQNTDTLTIDAMYGEQIPIILRIKEYSWSEEPYPPKVYRSVVWRVPTIDSIVVSENGEAVRSNSGSFTFDTVVNVLGEALSDEKKAQHLRFNWKSRKANATPQFGMTDRGWGQKVTIKASDLKNYKSSSIVTNDVYVLGAYEEVLLSNESVTLNGEKVYAREL